MLLYTAIDKYFNKKYEKNNENYMKVYEIGTKLYEKTMKII